MIQIQRFVGSMIQIWRLNDSMIQIQNHWIYDSDSESHWLSYSVKRLLNAIALSQQFEFLLKF